MSVVDSPSRFTPPPSIVLLRDFVNTVEWQVDHDEWESPVDLGSWFAEHAELAVHDLSIEDLELARRVREGLRSVLLMNAGHEPLETSIDDLNDALGVVPLRMRFSDDGSAVLAAAHSSALERALSVVMEAIEAAHHDGSWPRLKACSRDSCRWAYWDGSRNRSGRWCSMAGCGNYVKMRRRNSPEEAQADVISESASNRIPTLVDVAGRAGVSMKTVSNVVTGAFNVAEPTRSRVLAAIEELGYQPNLAARALRARRTAKPDAPGSEAARD
ncbi:putative RNA-binding Zn ribbon-like protein [Agromyces ramosus]|uniref:RNA-binding Zn ribbon-like protein n=1 Tax=Agromyces ramosus TaxID=33879 RepID=A0ABU0RDZ7_9MICO|nr:putative RNA-binding Zn ribbon-like protein [Agromyces ramosus]